MINAVILLSVKLVLLRIIAEHFTVILLSSSLFTFKDTWVYSLGTYGGQMVDGRLINVTKKFPGLSRVKNQLLFAVFFLARCK